MKLPDFSRRVDQLIEQADRTIATKWISRAGQEFVDAGLVAGLKAASLSFLINLFGKEHPFAATVNDRSKGDFLDGALAIRHVLLAAKDEMEGGWTSSLRGLVTAEVFSDFAEMAGYLLEEGYKDPAAVMMGGVLEEHLRLLCAKHSLPTNATRDGRIVTMKADLMNAELVRAGAYNKLDQKTVTMMLDLRNKAAHGQYDAYTREQVALMHQSAVDFMARNPL